jgi:4-hydroxy-3-methylbut-2-enyl diphosphate reductase
LVDRAADVDATWLAGAATVGLTSGASVPEVLVDEVLQWLAERGFDDVETVTSTVETVHFALPRDLP